LGLITPAEEDYCSDCLKEDHPIQPGGVIPDVVEILFRVEVHGFVAASMDLPPTRKPRGHGEPLSLPGFIFSTKYGISGRGPTQLISPMRMLNSCRSSSKLERRRNFPHRVTRGSDSELWINRP
jgi:hypothetical protein